MDSRLKKQTDALVALSAADRARLESLASLAGLNPDDLWPEVWQHGFDDVEESIQADLDATEYFKTNSGINNAEVMAKARAVVAVYGKPKRKAG